MRLACVGNRWTKKRRTSVLSTFFSAFTFSNVFLFVGWQTYQDAVKSRRGPSSLDVPQNCHTGVETQTFNNKLEGGRQTSLRGDRGNVHSA